MNKVKKLLPIQSQMLQAPYSFPDIRFFFCVAGYGSGKTSGLAYAILHTTKMLMGKKDLEGHIPKIMIASKNLTFLKKTLTGLLEQDLKDTNSEYKWDKASNLVTIGGAVQWQLIPAEDEGAIYGFSTFCFRGDTFITTDKGDIPISEIKVGDRVLTRKGFKKVTRVFNNGVKGVIKVKVGSKDIYVTPQHKFITSENEGVEAQHLTRAASLVKVDSRSWQKWLNTSGKIDRCLKLLISMELGITDTQKASRTGRGVTIPVQMRIREEATLLCTEIYTYLKEVQYLKGMMFITKMGILLTMLLKILNLLHEVNTLESIGEYNLKRKSDKHSRVLRRLTKRIKNFGKTIIINEECKKRWQEEEKESNISVGVKCVLGSLSPVLNNLAIALKNVKENGIKHLLKSNETRYTRKSGLALFVERILGRVNTGLLQPARLTAKTSNEVGQYTVYDIEVEEEHEYFANGVLVHNCTFLDELDELPTHTAMAVVKACNERTRQQVEGVRSPFLMFCTSSQGLKGTYQTVMHFKKSGVGYVLMKGRTRDNVYLEKDYVDNMYKIYNENEVKCFLEGEFISVESSLVFPDYNPDKNKLDVDLWDDVADDEVVYIGQDFNVGNNHAIAFVVKEFSNGESCIVAVKDYCFPDIRRAPEVFRYDFPKSKIVWIPDMTYKEHFSEFKKELRAFNITIAYRKTNPLVNDRVFACNKLFFSEHLFICPICKDLELALLSHQRDKRTGLPMKGAEKSPDHKSDCLGYAVHYLLSWHRGLKNLYDVTLRYLYSKRDARGSEAFLAEEGQVISASEIRRKVEFARNVDKV